MFLEPNQTLRRREYSSIYSRIAMLLATLCYCLLRWPKYNLRVRDISSSRLQLPLLKAHTLTFYLCLWSREIKGLRLMYQSRWRVSSHNKTHLASVSIRAQSPATHVSCILFWKGTRTSSSLWAKLVEELYWRYKHRMCKCIYILKVPMPFLNFQDH